MKELSPKQRQVCILTCQGLSYKEIAAEMGIPIGTVSKHKQRAKHKLNATNDIEIMHALISLGYTLY